VKGRGKAVGLIFRENLYFPFLQQLEKSGNAEVGEFRMREKSGDSCGIFLVEKICTFLFPVIVIMQLRFSNFGFCSPGFDWTQC